MPYQTAALPLVEEVLAAPPGARVGAFFDLDGTVIAGYSATAFASDQLRPGRVDPARLARAVLGLPRMALAGLDPGAMHIESFRMLAGIKEEEFAETGERIFREKLGARVYPEARLLIEAHRNRGHTVALCSSASRYQVGPIARSLGVDDVVCSELEVRKGAFTGKLTRNRWGEGKAKAAMGFARARGVDLASSWFYANGYEDLPLLERVGNPRPTNPDPRLRAHSRTRGWHAASFPSLRRPRPLDAARTLAAAASISPSMLAALPVALLKRDRREFVNLTLGLWTDWALAAADVSLSVTGAENLWSKRPAVFLFNHQSNLDPLIALALIRRDVTGVAKAELGRNPLMRGLLSLGDVAFVDRGDSKQAVSAINEVATKLKEGVSILVAPEGTRSSTREVLPFKKGAFRMAMAASVPVVPIVIRNSADALPRGSAVIRPCEVDVAVLAPVSVEAWSLDDLDGRIEAVRALYCDTLSSWPVGR